MRAVVIDDGDLRVEERPDPIPGPNEVLVAVASAGLNGADILQRRGFYPAPAGAPVDVPGLELAGTIVQLGDDVSTATIGQRVMAIVAGGAQATHCLVNEQHLLHVPAHIDLAIAGGFPEAYATAHDALVTQARLSSGDRVLISGAAGGVGSAAVQLASRLGATVIASARNPEVHESLLALGASVVVLPEDIGHAGPYDVVLELVGGPSLEVALTTLAMGARLAVIGVGAGARADINLLQLMGARAQLTGATLRARSVEDKAAVTEGVARDVLPLFDEGRLQVPVCATFGLNDVRAAYDRFTAGGKLGKVLLLPSE